MVNNMSNKAEKKLKECVDYKDVEALRKCVTETWQIIPSRLNGNSAKKQRRVNRAIKVARFLALIPYTDQHR